jgi:hypothetical protein
MQVLILQVPVFRVFEVRDPFWQDLSRRFQYFRINVLQFRALTPKLTLSVEKRVVQKAKLYARKRKKSLSEKHQLYVLSSAANLLAHHRTSDSIASCKSTELAHP